MNMDDPPLTICYLQVAHYIITYYLPSSLFVVVSWASFLIPSDDIQVCKAINSRNKVTS